MKPAALALSVETFAAMIAFGQTGGESRTSERLPIPVIYLLYPAPNGTIFDVNCGQLLNRSVSPESVNEAVRRAPELQGLWDREGPAYLSATFAEIGLRFPYKEMQAALTVCPGVTSMSTPLFLNVRRYLPSATPRDPDWLFVATVYHELMHTYVRPVSAISALRMKYAAEPPVVLNHLHVMALEKWVLLKLGKAEELKRIASDYQTLLPAPYKRAWNLVNDIEGYEPFMSELKQLDRRRR